MNRLFSSEQSVKMMARKVTHCIFDMDGLLLDTETLYTQGTQKILSLYGDKIYTFDVKATLMGQHSRFVAQRLIDVYELPLTVEEYLELTKNYIEPLMANCELLPGAEKLIRHLHEQKIPFCLATSSSEPIARIKIEKFKELFSLFNHSVMGSSDPEVKEGKPSPDIFLIAASRFKDKPNPADCLVFEDAPNGVKAGVSAGMQVVMVPDARCPEEDRKLATVVYKSLEDVKLEDFGLPPLKP